LDGRPLIVGILENVNFVIKSKAQKSMSSTSKEEKKLLKENEKPVESPNISVLKSPLAPPTFRSETLSKIPDPPIPPPISNPLKSQKEYIQKNKFRTKLDFDKSLFIEMENIQVIDEIPVQALDVVSECFTHAVKAILDDPKDPKNYIPYNLFASTVLIKTRLSGKKKADRKLSNLTRRALTFLNGDLDKLFEEAKSITSKKSILNTRSKKESDLNEKIINLTKHGREKVSLRLMKGEKRAVIDEKAKDKIQTKFPVSPELPFDEELMNEEKFEPIEFTMDIVMKAVSLMKKRSGGIDHLSGALLGQILRNSVKALAAYTELVNLYAAGKVPMKVTMLSLIRGLAMMKGANDFRPLGVPGMADGSTTKSMFIVKKKEIRKIVSDLCRTQLALEPRGAEVAAIATRDYTRMHSYPGSKKALLLGDLSNCFNLLNRFNLAQLFKKHCDFIYRYFINLYSGTKSTIYNGHTITIYTGSLQGCGLGPTACAMALAALFWMAFMLLLELDPSAFNVNLMDDMTFGGNEEALFKITEFIASEGPEKYGAFLNPPKTILYVLDSDLKEPTLIYKDVKRIVVTSKDGFDVGSKIEDDGIRFLGSPIGSPEFCAKWLTNRFKVNYEPLMDKIAALNHPSAAWRLWQRLSLEGGMIHVFRSTPPHLLEKSFPQIEKKIRSFVGAAIFGRLLSDQEWKICQLTFSLGGWNFIPFEVLAPCAYLSSLLANRDAVLALRNDATTRYDDEIKAITELILKNDPSAILPDLKSIPKQKDLVRAVMESRAATLLESVDARTKALLIGQRQPHSTLWKTAAHTAELFMAPEIFQTAALFSIGAKQVPVEICPVCKKVELDAFGDHALICMKEGHVVHRHNDAYRVFVTEARGACLPINVEKIIPITAEESYKADIFLPYGIPGLSSRSTALDLTITTNFNKTMVKGAAKSDLVAALSGENRKEADHEGDLNARGYDFIPLAFEATGGHSLVVNPIAHYLISQRAFMQGIPFTELAVNFWQRLSVSIQKSNATAIRERMKSLIPLESDD